MILSGEGLDQRESNTASYTKETGIKLQDHVTDQVIKVGKWYQP